MSFSALIRRGAQIGSIWGVVIVVDVAYRPGLRAASPYTTLGGPPLVRSATAAQGRAGGWSAEEHDRQPLEYRGLGHEVIGHVGRHVVQHRDDGHLYVLDTVGQ